MIDGGCWQPWVWSSDGTPDGTTPVSAADSVVSDFFSFRLRAARVPQSGDVRFLVQETPNFPEHLSKLSATDGTAAGTRELVQVPVQRFQYLDGFTAAGAYTFSSFRSDNRSSLWASDGTAEGTRRVADIAPGVESSSPSDLVVFGDRVLFSADDGRHGRELWVSGGTAEGTRLLEIRPGPRGSYPQAFRVVGGQVVFAADDGIHGLELWVTDGTPEGTRLAADVMAGPRASSPRHFEVFGDELFFNAGRPREGYELWKLPLTALEP